MAQAQKVIRPKLGKARLTLSLEEDTVRFLHQRQIKVHAPSMSALVESLVASERRQAEIEELTSQTAAYYDSISDEERAENMAWGRMAEYEFLAAER